MKANRLGIGMILLVISLSGCGGAANNTDSSTVEPSSAQSAEITDNCEINEDDTNTVTSDNENSDEANEDDEVQEAVGPVIENPTFVQSGDHEYTVYINCPDNSDDPDLEFLPSVDTVASLAGSSSRYGVSENLLNAIMTHAIDVDPMNAAQINYSAYIEKTITVNAGITGTTTYVLTSDPSNYGDDVLTYTMDNLKYNATTAIAPDMYRLCVVYLVDSLNSTNGNLTCALTRYNMGPDAWDQVMEECINATGLTAEQIYANLDSSYVLSFDTLGLGDPDYAGEVLQYIGSDPIVITAIDSNGEEGENTTYIIQRV